MMGNRMFRLVILVLAACSLAGARGVYAAAEADWFYEATELLERFEGINSAKLTPPQKQLAYYELLDEASRFAETQATPARAARARKAFGLLMTVWIQEQVGDGYVIKRAREAYAKQRELLPEGERKLIRYLFEPAERKTGAYAPRFCEVEIRGKKMRVTAVDYPITELLRKMAAVAGARIDVPPQVSGLVDFSSDGWVQADNPPYYFVARGRGLLAHGNAKEGFRIVVLEDPPYMYMASLAQRAREQIAKPPAKRPAKGITTGYLIMGGHYVEPPYEVKIRTVKNRGAVYINGMEVGYSCRLSREPQPPKPKPEVKGPRRFTLDDQLALAGFVNDMYVEVRKKRGHAAALGSIGDFLATQKIVKSWEFIARANHLMITFVNGDQAAATFPYYPTREHRPKATEADDMRKRALADLERRKLSNEKTLRENGLVIAPTNGPEHKYNGQEAREKLHAICHSLQEAVRHQEQLCAALFDVLRDEAPGWAWEVFLNLRHRDLVLRLATEPKP